MKFVKVNIDLRSFYQEPQKMQRSLEKRSPNQQELINAAEIKLMITQHLSVQIKCLLIDYDNIKERKIIQ